MNTSIGGLSRPFGEGGCHCWSLLEVATGAFKSCRNRANVEVGYQANRFFGDSARLTRHPRERTGTSARSNSMNPHRAASPTPENQGPPLILLAGATGTGKTALSIRLARELRTEIVNVDSVQVYRYLDIGSAKPSAEEQAAVVHHMIDVVDPDFPMDAGGYSRMARPVADSLRADGKAPLVVGGTGLYMKALTLGVCPGADGDPEIRDRLIVELEEHGLAALYEQLTQVDPERARAIHPNDRQRILRALEVYRSTGETLSNWQAGHGFRQRLYPAIKVFLHRDREDLYRRIDRRVDMMMEMGFREEVERILAMGYPPDLKSLQTLGYRQLIAHLNGEYGLDEAIRLIRRDTRRYAKRQLTWFRADAEFTWIHADDDDTVLATIKDRLRGFPPGTS